MLRRDALFPQARAPITPETIQIGQYNVDRLSEWHFCLLEEADPTIPTTVPRRCTEHNAKHSGILLPFSREWATGLLRA